MGYLDSAPGHRRRALVYRLSSIRRKPFCTLAYITLGERASSRRFSRPDFQFAGAAGHGEERRARAARRSCLPDPQFDLNRQGPVEAVPNRRDHAQIYAEALAFDREDRQRRDEPSSITVVRVAVEGPERDAGAHVEAGDLPVQGPPFVGAIVRARLLLM